MAKDRRKVKKIILIALLSVLGAALVALAIGCAVDFWYYAPYARSEVTFDIADASSDEMTVMSYNIRCYAPEDILKKSWFYRADLVIQTIEGEAPNVIAFQEVTPMHEKFLRSHLKGYEFVNAYRTSSGIKEGLMIAYQTSAFECLDSGHFWISDTPDKESKDWGTALPRIAVYATLKHRVTGKVFTVMDVHLDHISEEARRQGMRVLLEQKQEREIGSLIMLGDMNDFVDTPMYKQAVEGGLNDAKEIAASVQEGTGATYQGFGSKLNNKRIDFFFLTPDFTVNSYEVITKTFDGIYASDHFALTIKVTMGA